MYIVIKLGQKCENNASKYKILVKYSQGEINYKYYCLYSNSGQWQLEFRILQNIKYAFKMQTAWTN